MNTRKVYIIFLFWLKMVQETIAHNEIVSEDSVYVNMFGEKRKK